MAVKDPSRVDDYYSRRARDEGYPARSVYKLSEIDQKFKLLRPGLKVLDLGCAPGGWSLYAAGRIGLQGRLVGLDLKKVELNLPQALFMEGDLLTLAPAQTRLPGPFDVIVSDLAPATTGRREAEQARSLELVLKAWEWARELLKPGGHFLFKLFQSSEGEGFIRDLEKFFKKISRLKPRASRPRSQEIFVLARWLKPEPKGGIPLEDS